MNFNQIKKFTVWALASIFFFTAVFAVGLPAFADSGKISSVKENGMRVRVGYVTQPGLHEVDENGKISGYNYEYLRKIAQYTGWEYDYICFDDATTDIGLEKMYAAIAEGEIDIVGSTRNDSGVDALFPSKGAGMTSWTVLVRSDNMQYVEIKDLYRPTAETPFKVGLTKRAVMTRARLEEYFKINNIVNYRILTYDTTEEMDEAFADGNVDAVTGSDMSIDEGTRIIAKFASFPFYFAVSKQRPLLVQELDLALSRIGEITPFFQTELYQKYFGGTSELLLTTEEKEWISERNASGMKISVLMSSENAPYHSHDADGNAVGILCDIFDIVSKNTGLVFEFRHEDSYQKGLERFESGEIDILSNAPNDYDFADRHSLLLTEPYVAVPQTMIVNRLADFSKPAGERTIATVYGHEIPPVYAGTNVLRFENVRQVFEAVNSGKAELGFANLYSAAYYNSVTYRNVSVVNLGENASEYCMGVRKGRDLTLLSILDKSIRNISAQQLETIIFENSVKRDKEVSLGALIREYPIESILIIASFFVLVSVVIGILLFFRHRSNRKIAFDNQKYLKLTELANEFLYEYEHRHSRLMLSEKAAELFSHPKVQEMFPNQINVENETVIGEILAHARSEERFERDYLFRIASGRKRWFRVLNSTIFDASGRPILSIGKLTDIQSEKEELFSLVEKSRRDGLTDLLNASAAREEIEERLSFGESGLLLILDVDRFKKINDTLGHIAGDDVLVRVSKKLRDFFSEGDMIGRMGGDEFCVLTDETDERAASELLGNLVRMLRINGRGLDITFSVGAAFFGSGDSFEQVYKAADSALYRAKAAGRNGFSIAEKTN